MREDIDRALKINVKGVFLVLKYAVLEMKRPDGGVVVNIASVAALKGVAFTPPQKERYSHSPGQWRWIISMINSLVKIVKKSK